VRVLVNGHEEQWNNPVMTYDELVRLAGKTGYPTAVYYWSGDGDHHRSGSLFSGRSVNVADGMHFTVIHTSRA
jgi:hypothetical protein